MTRNELDFLESKVKTYITSESLQDQLIKNMAIQTFSKFIERDKTALEFGCCDGFMSSMISKMVKELTIVDGSKTFLKQAAEKCGSNTSFIHSLFEDYKSTKKFDYIFATYILEHVESPQRILNIIYDLLAPNGLAFIVVPNARALSRQLARHMGIISDLYNLTPNDINHGHRRVYDRATLNKEIESTKLIQISQGGLMLKPFADFQMEELIKTGFLKKEHQDALYSMGLEYPDFCGSLFSICKK